MNTDLKAFTEQYGKNEAVEALFRLGAMFREEENKSGCTNSADADSSGNR